MKLFNNLFDTSDDVYTFSEGILYTWNDLKNILCSINADILNYSGIKDIYYLLMCCNNKNDLRSDNIYIDILKIWNNDDNFILFFNKFFTFFNDVNIKLHINKLILYSEGYNLNKLNFKNYYNIIIKHISIHGGIITNLKYISDNIENLEFVDIKKIISLEGFPETNNPINLMFFNTVLPINWKGLPNTLNTLFIYFSDLSKFYTTFFIEENEIILQQYLNSFMNFPKDIKVITDIAILRENYNSTLKIKLKNYLKKLFKHNNINKKFIIKALKVHK